MKYSVSNNEKHQENENGDATGVSFLCAFDEGKLALVGFFAGAFTETEELVIVREGAGGGGFDVKIEDASFGELLFGDAAQV